jgi:hypothetical protein
MPFEIKEDNKTVYYTTLKKLCYYHKLKYRRILRHIKLKGNFVSGNIKVKRIKIN